MSMLFLCFFSALLLSQVGQPKPVKLTAAQQARARRGHLSSPRGARPVRHASQSCGVSRSVTA